MSTRKGSLHPKRVTVPGVFIDAVVMCDDPEQDHRMTHSFYEDFAYCGDIKVPIDNESTSLTPFQDERSYLRGSFTLRCLQRLSRPDVATQLCSWQNNWCTSGQSIPVLSY